MNKPLRLLLLLFLWTVASISDSFGQGASFPCDGKLYQIRQVGTTTRLFRVDRTTNPYTTVELQNLGLNLNCLAYNQLDNYLYAITYSNSAVPILYRIGQGGIVSLGNIRNAAGTANLGARNYAGGAIDENGIYYFSSEAGSNTAFSIDLKTVTAVTLPRARTIALGANYSFFDLAINPLDNEIYASNFEGILYRIVPNAAGGAATVSTVNSTVAVNGGQDPVGTLFFDAGGTLLAASNGSTGGTDEGNFYIININATQTASTWVRVTTLPRSTQSDGASCIYPPQKIDVVKSVGAVTQVSTTEFTIPYTIRVKNTATELGVNAQNIQVSEFLYRTATTDNTSNITFGAANLPTDATRPSTVENLTITDDDPDTNYVLNNTGGNAFNGSSANEGARAGLLATGQTLNQGRTITITFTARIRFSAAGNVPSVAQLNTAIASSSTVSNTGYRLDPSSGTYIPPIDLLAADQSTNSANLPATPNGDTPSPTPVNFTASIAGTVFEDVNYGGGPGRSQTASAGVGVSGVRVELYRGSTYQTFTTTDADGFYSFGGLINNQNYVVRVVNNTVRSTREGGAGAGTAVLPVTTYINGDKVGGNYPNGTDPGASTTTLPATTAQSYLQINARTGNPAVVDFGFNFSTVVNTNDSGQGSLRQFITNSNALRNDNTDLSTGNDLNQVGQTAGVEAAIFMIPTTSLAGTGTSRVATITLASALPAITDNNTTIDGTLQTTNRSNSNTAVLGTGNTVGTGATSLNQVNGPEVQIVIPTTIGGVSISGNNAVINGIALYGSSGNALTVSGNAATISNNVLGTTATSFADPGTARTAGSQLAINGGSGTVVRGNLIGFAGQSGITVATTASGLQIIGNEIASNGRVTVDADGITMPATGVVVQNNLIRDNAGMGVDMAGGSGGASISGNTISGNGVGLTTTAPTSTAGVLVSGTNNLVLNNLLNGNYGAGVMVVNGSNSTRISQNSTVNNGNVTAANGASASGQLGIDLLTSTDNATTGTSPYRSLNASGKTDASGANSLLNFPIITQAAITDITNGNLIISGYAPAGSTIELFLADRTVAAYGQGQSYLLSLIEGGTVNGITDTDNRTSSYANLTVESLNQGSETNANRFYYTIPLSSIPTGLRSSVTGISARLTATATVAGATTSEFSGNIAINRNSPLPVTLTSFTAQAAGQDARLTWATAQELNNSHFVVERSLDGETFEAVQQVQGQGTKATATTYAFTDVRAAARANDKVLYYRLRQVDTDGTSALTGVQTVRFAVFAAKAAVVYPNPTAANTDATLDLSAVAADTYQVTISDVAGRVVRTFSQQGGTNQPLQVAQLPGGSYLIQVKGTSQSFVTRLLKQ
jgi:trimeric autotransporter adhesin